MHTKYLSKSEKKNRLNKNSNKKFNIHPFFKRNTHRLHHELHILTSKMSEQKKMCIFSSDTYLSCYIQIFYDYIYCHTAASKQLVAIILSLDKKREENEKRIGLLSTVVIEDKSM